MLLKHIELANFRKLVSVRIDLSDQTTLFVGANNSGKTSAMVALRRFLVRHGKDFRAYDLTLSHWEKIKTIGNGWASATTDGRPPDLSIDSWVECMPALDVWLDVEEEEIHHVRTIIPTLSWTKGLLGVRLRLEPEDMKELYQDFMAALEDAAVLKKEVASRGGATETTLKLWPEDLLDFFSRDFMKYLTLRTYVLDPAKLSPPVVGRAFPQKLSPSQLPIDGFPLKGLIRVNEINAQRGFGDATSPTGDDATPGNSESRRLSEQLRAYYAKHLDPTDKPNVSDLGALEAIESAQDAFNTKLTESFSEAFLEVEGMGYPGVTDPKITVATRLRAVDSLNHEAAVSFEIDVVSEAGEITPVLKLPEDNNGLGYQNLISMIFRLMAFRDAWMRIGKASKVDVTDAIEPLQLVLIEEPEAHLHAQVQQVFVRKAYSVLRNHKELGDKNALRTQLVVSSHSSHVAHEIPFRCLRYFRRLPAGLGSSVPNSIVVNLSETFGKEDETERFVTRYLRSQHADLFFADAAILVEGPAEKMLVPNFIRAKYPFLNQCYLSVLEIGGSHAHRLAPLVKHLGLTTLVITDLDSEKEDKAVPPKRNDEQVTNNDTLSKWLPCLTSVDDLLDLPEEKKSQHTPDDTLFAVRVAYQYSFKTTKPGSIIEEEVIPYTFEDALVFENLDFFQKLKGTGLIKKFKDAIDDNTSLPEVGVAMFNALKKGKKAEFALDIIAEEAFDTLVVPRYLANGLGWLETKLRKKNADIVKTGVGSGIK